MMNNVCVCTYNEGEGEIDWWIIQLAINAEISYETSFVGGCIVNNIVFLRCGENRC